MKNYSRFNQYILILLGFTLVFGACRTKKRVPKVDRAAIERNNSEKISAIQQAQASFNTLSLRAKASLNMDGSINDVTINLRIAKDQRIWVSVTAIAALEVARILITPDSIHILNRLESVYIKKPFSFISNYTNQQINFGTLQSVLVGNVWNEVFTQKPDIISSENSVQLNGRSGSLSYQLQFNELFKLNHSLLQDTLNNQQLSVSYADFFSDVGLILPHQLKLQSRAAKNTINADLRYTKIEKDIALDFPFSVPKRFSVKN